MIHKPEIIFISSTILIFVYQPAIANVGIGAPVQNQQMQLPRLLQDPNNCPLNACEVLKILSQHLRLFKSTNSIGNNGMCEKNLRNIFNLSI